MTIQLPILWDVMQIEATNAGNLQVTHKGPGALFTAPLIQFNTQRAIAKNGANS